MYKPLTVSTSARYFHVQLVRVNVHLHCVFIIFPHSFLLLVSNFALSILISLLLKAFLTTFILQNFGLLFSTLYVHSIFVIQFTFVLSIQSNHLRTLFLLIKTFSTTIQLNLSFSLGIHSIFHIGIFQFSHKFREREKNEATIIRVDTSIDMVHCILRTML